MSEQSPASVHDRITSDTATSTGNGHSKPKKSKPKVAPPKAKATKVLPTERITPAKQVEIIRSYAILSGADGKSVTNEDVGKLVKLQASTVAMSNSFFVGVGFLEKT